MEKTDEKSKDNRNFNYSNFSCDSNKDKTYHRYIDTDYPNKDSRYFLLLQKVWCSMWNTSKTNFIVLTCKKGFEKDKIIIFQKVWFKVHFWGAGNEIMQEYEKVEQYRKMKRQVGKYNKQ